MIAFIPQLTNIKPAMFKELTEVCAPLLELKGAIPLLQQTTPPPPMPPPPPGLPINQPILLLGLVAVLLGYFVTNRFLFNKKTLK